ncbi:MAG: hypothetical protein J6A63_06215 [Clostridia bacterium]|nr:hypothetical protein [Clostridia bacterium]
MEILMLVLLYYLSQNPDFHESVKPLMGQLKNSEQMLSFLNDLSKFSQTFTAFQAKKGEPPQKEPPQKEPPQEPEEKQSASPTNGIADEFIQQILDSYLTKK